MHTRKWFTAAIHRTVNVAMKSLLEVASLRLLCVLWAAKFLLKPWKTIDILHTGAK